MPKSLIHPVILSGGAGTRLWPLSREGYPKQFLPLMGEHSLLQQAILRVQKPGQFAAPILVCNESHRFLVAEQLRTIGVTPAAIILEPEGRNTAPAAAIAAHFALKADKNAQILVLPSDHYIDDTAQFQEDVAVASEAAKAGYLATFGIKPTQPETGYGYIRRGAALKSPAGTHKLEAFVEKPDRKKAAAYIKTGKYYWNSGMFLFPAALYLEELKKRQPEMATLSAAALSNAQKDLDFLRPDAEIFKEIASDSIDYAVMEHITNGAVVPARFGWQDLGAWDALYDLEKKDKNKNVLLGHVHAEGVKGSYIRSEDKLTAVIGLKDIMVITTDDAVLVAPRKDAQKVKELVSALKAQNLPEATTHRRVFRPWGYYEGLCTGSRFQVKRLVVKPGGKLSLQQHRHRAEHWVVVSGNALVTRNNEEFAVNENESVYIPIGSTHRIQNPGKIPLAIIEVQTGTYLGEDDIVRLSDTYGRV